MPFINRIITNNIEYFHNIPWVQFLLFSPLPWVKAKISSNSLLYHQFLTLNKCSMNICWMQESMNVSYSLSQWLILPIHLFPFCQSFTHIRGFWKEPYITFINPIIKDYSSSFDTSFSLLINFCFFFKTYKLIAQFIYFHSNSIEKLKVCIFIWIQLWLYPEMVIISVLFF